MTTADATKSASSYARPQRARNDRSRCFVIDTVCAFEFGHSLNSLNYFSDLASNYWPTVTPVASYHLPKHGTAGDKIERYFDFYYDRFLPIARKPIPYNGGSLPTTSDPLRRALADFSDFFFYKRLGPHDSLILNNADIYSVAAILTLCDGWGANKLPSIYLRFIGVMEHATVTGDVDFDKIVARLKDLKMRGHRIAISAETPTLARTLERKTACKVWTTPYPLSREDILPLPDGPQFPVLCGGSARIDKGFLRLPAIIEHVNRTHAKSVRFVVQNLPPIEQPPNLAKVASLYASPNVDLLEGILSFPEILDAYRNTCVSIMPYDQGVYAERGSAILMESIMYGRLVIGQSDTAFSEQILIYNCGEICKSDEDFARAIIRLSSLPRSYLAEQASQARRRYLVDVQKAYEGWLEDLT